MITTRNRQATWSTIGKDVTEQTSIADVITSAGLDYNVVKKTIQVDGQTVPNRFATVREDTGECFGIVRSNYNILQNAEAFSFIEDIEDNIKFVKAGQTAGGLVYVIGAMEDVNIVGDKYTPYVIFQNGHDGNITLKTTICPLRIVCQNQFVRSFQESANTISIRHTNQLAGRINEASAILKGTAEYMRAFNVEAESLASRKITTNTYELFNQFFAQQNTKKVVDTQLNEFGTATPIEVTSGNVKLIEDKTNMLYDMYMADDNQNFTGTVWGAVNAFADYTTHTVGRTDVQNDNKFVSVTFDPRVMSKFINFMVQNA